MWPTSPAVLKEGVCFPKFHCHVSNPSSDCVTESHRPKATKSQKPTKEQKALNKQLFDAAAEGGYLAVERLAAEGASPDARGADR